MRFPARSTLAVALVGALPLAAPSTAPAATTPDVNGTARNVPYGSIAERADTAVRTTARARQVAAAMGMPYFVVVQAAADTSAADTSLAGDGQSAQPAVPTTDGVVVNVNSGSGTSTSTWLLGGAAVLLALVALLVALQPRWRAARAERASHDRPRAR